MKTILLIGGSSFIGLQCLPYFSKQYNCYATYYKNKIEVNDSKILQLDLHDKEKTEKLIFSVKPDVIILCSAISTLVEEKEFEKEIEEININAVKNVSEASKVIAAKLILISTDCVFSGENGPYKESDVVSPKQLYGVTKKEAEKIVRELSDYAIIRTSLVYGWPQQFQHDNFVTNLIKKIRKREEFSAHLDMYRTPTYVSDISKAISNIIKNHLKGTFHAAAPEFVNMFDFGLKVCEVFNLSKDQLKASFAPEEYRQRPKRAGLYCKKSEEQLNIKFKTIEEGLQEMKNTTPPQYNIIYPQQKQTVLVTGGAGFIGSHLVEALVKKRFKVKVLDSLVKGKIQSIKYLIDQGEVQFIEGDIRNKDAVDEAMKEASFVFHTAGIHIDKSVKSPDDCIANNIQGSYNVFKSALDHKVQRVIFSSSSSVYGDPKKLPMVEDDPLLPAEPYGASKLFCEHLLQHLAKKGLKYNTLRYFNVYGERQAAHAYYTTVVIHFIKRIISNEPPTIDGKGDQSMDFTHVSDVVQANILAMESKTENEAFNVGTGVSTSVKKLTEIIIKALERDLQPIFRERDVFVTKRQADTRKAESLLGFKTSVKVEDGITQIAHEIAHHPERYY